jgi:alpha-tubulin suppressor-like RCC1 family protein
MNLTSISFPIHDTTRPRHEPTLLLTRRVLPEPNTAGDNKLEWMHIECGNNYTVGVTKNGKVFSWGDNGWGQLGHTDMKYRIKPKRVKALRGIVIIKVSCGYNHTAAITDKGEILTWYVHS